MTAAVSISRIEYRMPNDARGIDTRAPRLTWIVTTDHTDWMQGAYEVEVDGVALGKQVAQDSVFVPWPTEPLSSRRVSVVRVRVWDTTGIGTPWSDPVRVEAGLLDDSDWTASWITTCERDPQDGSAPAAMFRRAFTLGRTPTRARLYATSAGIQRIELNGTRVGDDVLSPGWTAYRDRLQYETYDVTELVREGSNVLGAIVADGWWRGYLGWYMQRNVYGDRIGLLAQLEVTYDDGSVEVVGTDRSWESTRGPIRAADLYNGETYDARAQIDGWSESGNSGERWSTVETFDPTVGSLVARLGPPIRRTGEIPVQGVLASPSGGTILDFGQNLVGRVRFMVSGPAGTTITLRHAEVLEHGELGTRPLRNARATDQYTLRGDSAESWEPEFTVHGFRYVQVDGWPGPLDPAAFTAVVIHTDLERTGTFECSDELVTRLHENVVWGLRGNVVGIPTDCPQRDERLGWTGDIQMFGPTATFLYEVAGFLSGWLADLSAEQRDGIVPVVVPGAEHDWFWFPAAAWGDAATIVPWTLHERYGDTAVLERQFDSMKAWVDAIGALAGERYLWDSGFQFGDWLDPDAPPDRPDHAKTDAHLVATAYFARSAQIVSDAAKVLDRSDVATEYAEMAARVRAAFRDEYVTPSGRLVSDSATAYSLALQFDLLDPPTRPHAVEALARAVRRAGHHISTGFVGTPLVLPALSEGGDITTAYRLLMQTECPSWLYPVTMGATTIWERWDSMLPDGTINPGQMTSFNHYALGAVADWIHRTIGGLEAASPAYRTIRIAPVPGGGLTSARATLVTPYGPAACSWEIRGAELTLEATIPPNTTAVVALPGVESETLTVGSGSHRWMYAVDDSVLESWGR